MITFTCDCGGNLYFIRHYFSNGEVAGKEYQCEHCGEIYEY